MKMNSSIRGKAAIFCTVLFLGLGTPSFLQAMPGMPSIESLTDAMDSFADSMALALPFNASMGLNWSDAYIGRFFPSIPPHFGAGVALGFTTMDIDPLRGLLGKFGFPDTLPDWGGFPIPGAIVEGRLGGFFLPFDMGVKVGFLPFNPGPVDRLDNFLVGADIRYAVMEGNLILPTISVGVGINYLSGGIERGLDDVHLGFMGPEGADTLIITAPRLGVEWETVTLDFRAQVSRSILIITPYVGIGASHGWSRVSYGMDADIGSSYHSPEEVRAILRQMGIDTDGEAGFSSEREINGWSFRAFGGISFNLPLIRLDLTGLWNMRDGNFGVTLGARFQL